MKPQIGRQLGRVLWGWAWLLLVAAGPTDLAWLSDGQIIDSSPVTLSKAAVEELSSTQPDIRAILDRVAIQAVTYLSDGLKVKGYLAAPKQGANLPCVIYNRGGSRDFGALNDQRAASFLAPIASWGYVVVASNYRGSPGSEGKDEFGGADVNDVLHLLPLLGSKPQADTSRVGIYGWSRGGLMTYLALTKTDQIAAAVIGAGASDAFDAARRRPEMETQVYAQLIPGFATNRDAALAARSPVLWADKLAKKTPLLLLQGSADSRVHPSQAFKMAEQLFAHQHPFRLVFFEGGEHGLFEHQAEVDRLTRDWLDRYVRDHKPVPAPNG